MKRQLTLRTRMFLSISALMTVALIGLLLGVFSVMQMGREQERVIAHNFATIDISQSLRHALDEQMVQLLGEHPDGQLLDALRADFRRVLDQGRQQAQTPLETQLYTRIEQANGDFQASAEEPGVSHWNMLGDGSFGQQFTELQQSLLALHNQALQTVSQAETQSRHRAWLIASLLGAVGLAILLIGVLTARSIARRFGEPIEALARAAGQIGQGDFNVTLPLTPVDEMAALTRRFGQMAEALRQYQDTNVQAIRVGRRRLQGVLDSIDDGLVIIDRDYRIEHANPVAIRQLFSRHDPHGQRLAEVLNHAELLQAAERVFAGQGMAETPQDMAVRIAGENRLLAWTLMPVNHEDGSNMGAVLVSRDVTELRAFERVRSEFVLRASHELRTPVTGMHMAFGLLRERLALVSGSRERELAETVEEEMQRLVKLIDDLLNFSRYQDGQQTLDRRPCAPLDLLGEAQQRFEQSARKRGIDIRLELENDLPALSIDHLRMERVLDNLLGNAIRHTADGGHIRLLAQKQEARLLIAVEDTGEGIPYSQQARIFEPFVQVGKRSGGAGLGLALCKEIVQLHGGRIGVRSQPGSGTRFYMLLPI
ncbi:MAG: Alginate biosynthesis sensor protein KinB [Pseudomonas citronellolis]|nr:MAG: Alginate biosynthesis sensor protein KinB [Pseudomonas citronellolis]